MIQTHHLPPGPKDGMWGMTLARRFQREPLEFLTELGRTYGDLAYVKMGPIRICLVNHPQLIHEVLVSQAKNIRKVPAQVRLLGKIDGQGLVITEGELWRRQRRLVQPAFAMRRMDRYAQVIVERSARLFDGWSTGQTHDIAQETTHLTLEIIAKTLFDVELSGQAAQLGEAVRVVSETVYREAGALVQLPDWLPIPSKRRKRWAIRMLDDTIWEIIRQRRASGTDQGDLLSMLLLAVDEEGDGGSMTDEQARDEAMTLFNAGHDSTAAGLAWIWYLLAQHPEVQTRLSEEADRVLAGRPATFDDVQRLVYTGQVVNESLRLYPPTWILLPRESVSDLQLRESTLPRGTWLYFSPFVTQRDPRFFPEPEKFDPDRFSAERADEIPQHAWFPFGAGPHICIGINFALMEMTLIVATLLQRFRFRLAANQGSVEPEPLVAIRPRGGLKVTLA